MAPIGTLTILESRLWMLAQVAQSLREKSLPPDPKLTTMDPRSFAAVKCLSEVNEACKISGYPDMRETDERERYRAAWHQCYALTENSTDINQTEIGQIANEVCAPVPKLLQPSPTPATEEDPKTKPNNERIKLEYTQLNSGWIIAGEIVAGAAVLGMILWTKSPLPAAGAALIWYFKSNTSSKDSA